MLAVVPVVIPTPTTVPLVSKPVAAPAFPVRCKGPTRPEFSTAAPDLKAVDSASDLSAANSASDPSTANPDSDLTTANPDSD